MELDSYDYSPPEWLTESYLEQLLKKYKKDKNLAVLSVDIKPATGKGENYVSVMTRVKITYQSGIGKDTHQGSFIVKSTFESNPFINNLFKPYDMYNTEMRMYEKVLPQLNALLREIGDDDKLFAETMHVDYEHSAIIFEDLSVAKFVMADRLVGMDEVLAKLALKKLAKMHAASAVLNERMPNLVTTFDHGIFNRYTRAVGPFFENILEVCANYAADCPELGDYYKQKLLKLKQCVVEYATRVYDPRAGHFHILNHGDFWINNVMIRYDETTNAKVIQDLIIIDLQCCAWASPAVDLHYFLNTSLEGDLRMNSQDILIQYYYRILAETLTKLKFAGHIPTLQELYVQLEAGRFYAVTSSLVSQPIMINDKTDDADIQSLISDDERGRNFRKILYTNKVVQENVKKLLPIFDRRGLLDVASEN